MEKFHGAYVAIVTPFKDNKVDEKSFINLIEFQIKNGTHGIVPCGTTGESATLSFDEHKRVMDLAIQVVDGRVPVIAGTGANNTIEAIELSESAKESGADAILSVAPYYNKPCQEGIYQHFKAITEAVDIPLFVYNVPGRTVVNIAPETTARLAQLKNVIGIKEASGNLEQISDVLRMCPKDFIVHSGDDFTSMPTVLLGGKGVISVISNVYPKGMSEMMEAALAGNVARANELHFQMYDLMKQMFAYPSPAPAKKGLELLNIIENGDPRIPMMPINDSCLATLKDAMKGLDLL